MKAMLVGVVLATLASAQSLYAQEGTKTPVPHQQTVSANPFGLMVGWFNAEYERKVRPTMTIGVSGSNLGIGDTDLQRANLLFRFYPQGAALTGVYFGGRGGFARVGDNEAHAHAFSAGIDIGYSWLFGSKRNVGLSVGAGIDRLFGGDLDGFNLYWPNIRLVNIGVAF